MPPGSPTDSAPSLNHWVAFDPHSHQPPVKQSWKGDLALWGGAFPLHSVLYLCFFPHSLLGACEPEHVLLEELGVVSGVGAFSQQATLWSGPLLSHLRLLALLLPPQGSALLHQHRGVLGRTPATPFLGVCVELSLPTQSCVSLRESSVLVVMKCLVYASESSCCIMSTEVLVLFCFVSF